MKSKYRTVLNTYDKCFSIWLVGLLSSIRLYFVFHIYRAEIARWLDLTFFVKCSRCVCHWGGT